MRILPSDRRNAWRATAARFPRLLASLRLFLVVAVAVLLAACAMSESSLIDTTMNGSCALDGGTYYLPRSLVKVIVNEDASPPPGSNKYYLDEVTSTAHQDRRYAYCLDYLKAPTSADTFVVHRDPDLLLGRITSNADDKSKEIAKSLIQAIFVGISGNPQFGRSGGVALLGKTKRFEVEYDPFDDDQAAVINDSLKDYGYCLILETPRFLARGRPVQDYCDRPLERGQREAALLSGSNDKISSAPPAHSQGVFYRARLPYNYVILEKEKLGVRGGWNILGTKTVLFENESPIFSVAVDRTYFAHRKTTLEFDRGTLTDVTISKNSELKEFAEIPLTIAQSVAALPASILQVKIDATNNRQKLLQAQKTLLDSQRTYLASLADLKTVEGNSPIKSVAGSDVAGLLGRSAGGDQTAQSVPSAAEQSANYNQCVADCSRDPAAGAQCESFCQCRVVKCPSFGDDAACDATCIGLKPKS